jgi:hypothetical protein
MVRTVFQVLLLLVIPLALIGAGIHGMITGQFSYKTGHAYGLSARVLSSSGVLAGLVIMRVYWVVGRKDGAVSEDPIVRVLLVLGAVALGAGLILIFLSVAF